MTPIAFADAGSARVAVVIVTRGAWAWTQRALAALHRYTPDVEVVIVDNASPDGTPERLEGEVEGVRLVANAENVGFARAANQGAELAGGELVAFLNNDALVHDVAASNAQSADEYTNPLCCLIANLHPATPSLA